MKKNTLLSRISEDDSYQVSDEFFSRIVEESTPVSDQEIDRFCNENQISNKLRNVVKALYSYMILGVLATSKLSSRTSTISEIDKEAEIFGELLERYISKNTTKEEREFLYGIFSQRLKGAPLPDEIFNDDKNVEIGMRLTNKIIRDIVTILRGSVRNFNG